MAVNNRLRPPRRFTRVLAPPPEAQPHEGETLAERYSRMAHEGWRPAPVDFALRGLDILLASLALLLLAPLLAVIWALVRLGSRGPAIYRGVRVGKAGRVFTMFKFRTLQVDAESRLGPYLGAELSRLTEDELTRVGRRLRAAHLDELPQLVNVLMGQMSLVGPRPLVIDELGEYGQRAPALLSLHPGMTGAWAIAGRSAVGYPERCLLELSYVHHWSIWADLRILWRTVPLVLRARGAH